MYVRRTNILVQTCMHIKVINTWITVYFVPYMASMIVILYFCISQLFPMFILLRTGPRTKANKAKNGVAIIRTPAINYRVVVTGDKTVGRISVCLKLLMNVLEKSFYKCILQTNSF
jgi:hypothetical protein